MKDKEIKFKDLSKVDFDSPELKNEYDLLLKRLERLIESTNADWNRIDRVDVFSRKECIFNYCPHPDKCKEECLTQNQRR